MTAEYRAALIRLLANQARGERYAAHAYARWVPRVRDPDAKRYLANLAREETEHWYRTVKLLEPLGIPAERAVDHESPSWFYAAARLRCPRRRWLDLLWMSVLIEHAAYFMVEDYAKSSYAPYARVAQQILAEEAEHPDFGVACLRREIERQGRAAVQRALGRWWAIALNAFGPAVSRHHEVYVRLGLKQRSNEERRELFRRSAEDKIRGLQLGVPRLARRRYPFI